MTAATACSACGTDLLKNARFCHACGSSITTPDAGAEYKQVTVLFADVVQSMDLAAAVGPERLREIVGELARRATAVVQRYGGTVDKFTGDGVMALFGAPRALEDHAIRACLAALDIQRDARVLAAEVEHRDGVELRLRVGLNSGEVIAGEIDSGTATYTVIGEQVGMAQRMESVAPAGGVMLSDSTARLVEDVATLGEPETMDIKGFHGSVVARCLLGVAAHRHTSRVEPTFVGREWELNALGGILDQAVKGKGSVVGVVGPAGIGKSRIVGEAVALATRRGMDSFTAYCESHTSEVPFHAATEVLRAVIALNDLDSAAARGQVRARLSDADPDDLLLLDDLLGIADPDATAPQIDPDARRRRLTAMVNAAALARVTPAVLVIEDVHWIDEISESMIAGFLAVVPRSHWLVVITYRPEYDGALSRTTRSQTLALEPLDDSQISALSSELLGDHPSVGALAATISKRAAGNPFFAEEIVRDLVERGVLTGARGAYVCEDPATEVSVPGTLQATIAARIDRLSLMAKRTLSAAAVIGSRFGVELLTALQQVDPSLDELLAAELVDQVTFTTRPEYAFRHPLIRAVAYESQLKSDRAQLHRRLAGMIGSDDQNAALIAEHLEAAGDLVDAYQYHMRAGTWLANRDYPAARAAWQRARQVADRLPADHPNRMAMRIGPRTLLCGSAYRTAAGIADVGFDELRDLCTAAGDKSALAVGMAGLVSVYVLRNRIREASQLASEYMGLVESLDDPVLTVGLSFSGIIAKIQRGEMGDVLRWSQRVIDLAAGDPEMGNLFVASPLSAALAFRGTACFSLGQPGWREDFERAVRMARSTDLSAQAVVFAFSYGLAIPRGVLLADVKAVQEIEEALQIAERASDEVTFVLLRFALCVALMHRDGADDRQRGVDMLIELRRDCVSHSYAINLIPGIDALLGREMALRGDVGAGVAQLRAVTNDVYTAEYFWPFVLTTALLVETLLERGTNDDLVEAEAAIARMAALPSHIDPVGREISLLRLRALVARARGDESTYREHRDRYLAMSTSLGFEGHIAMATQMA
ncbi:adenylate/guanylate cyclase domain-containing protein [Mycobacterium sp. 3519A]|uniref:adenylate/guanylate cyclase domain-containing protein n=1 Tax=Mycobacterium sp. 3519A TaxID=2057184 RepID=UPI000C7CB99F|nr:adenylate/guanylate cyclase domain-containing protein [Mycobacterium sp. 3519A]